MSAEPLGVDRRRLGEMLVAAGVLGAEQLQAALAEQQRWGEPLGRTLVQMGVLSEDLVARALSRQLGIPACDPMTMELAPGIAGHIALHLVEQFGVMPVVVDEDRKVLFVATSDPTDKRGLALLGDQIGWTIQPVIASARRIELAIRKHYYGEGGEVDPIPSPAAAFAAPGRGPGAALAAGSAAELAGSIAELERLAAGQLRALRVLVEMLVEKGIIRHEDYLARVRGDESR